MDLLEALKAGHYIRVLQLLQEGNYDPNVRNENDQTALMLAVRKGHQEAITQLLAAGTDVNHFDIFGQTALLWAVHNRDVTSVKQLLQAGARISTPSRNDRSPLIEAIKRNAVSIVKLLLQNGADVNVRYWLSGETAFICAVSQDNDDIVALLLAAGADINQTDTDGVPALNLALPRTATVKLLIHQGVNVNQLDRQGETVLMMAIRKKYFWMMETLLQAGVNIYIISPRGESALSLALNRSKVPVEILLRAGANIYEGNVLDIVKKSPPTMKKMIEKFMAVYVDLNPNDLNFEGHSYFIEMVQKNHYSAVKYFSTQSPGYDINYQDVQGRTALHHALDHPKIEIIKLLLQMGADPSLADHQQLTAYQEVINQDNQELYDLVQPFYEESIERKYRPGGSEMRQAEQRFLSFCQSEQK